MTNPTNDHRILVVDDEPSIVDAVATALRYEGYDVEEAATGREALAAVAALRARPGRARLDAARHRRASRSAAGSASRASRPAVLFLTAKDATEDKVEALRAGGDDYVTKPFSLAEIVARVAGDPAPHGRASCRATCCASPTSMLDESRHEVFRGDDADRR